VVLLQPEEGVGNEERAHFVAAVVEDQRAPVELLALARVGVLVERGAVEEDQAVSVLGEMRRHPIDNHANEARWQASTKYWKSSGVPKRDVGAK
jgi:hypothetical protein